MKGHLDRQNREIFEKIKQYNDTTPPKGSSAQNAFKIPADLAFGGNTFETAQEGDLSPVRADSPRVAIGLE